MALIIKKNNKKSLSVITDRLCNYLIINYLERLLTFLANLRFKLAALFL